MTMPMLTKLFATSMVASNLCGICNSVLTKLPVLVPDVLTFSFDSGVNEKNATSDPETNADDANNRKSTAKPMMTLQSIG